MRGQKPVFSILMEHFIHRCAYAAMQRKAHGGPLRSAILFFYRRHEGVCRWLVSRADPFFCLAKGGSFL